MRADALARRSPPATGARRSFAQVGNVNGGAVDPMEEVCAAAHEAGAWVHVDGAFGLWAAASPARRHLVAGVERADSWATDAHKWLNVPYDCGIAFVRDREAHRAAISVTAAYLVQDADGPREPMDWTPEFSRRARGFASTRRCARSAATASRSSSTACARARSAFAAGSATPASRSSPQELNQVLVACGATTPRPTRRSPPCRPTGTCFPSGTTWRGRRCIRLSVCNWQTTFEDVDRSIDAMAAAARPGLAPAGRA